jgi:hypothetical protein
MKTLEEEARFLYGNLENGIGADRRSIFIAGANSKWVKAEKIKAQIEIMEMLDERIYKKSGSRFWNETYRNLQQQLKQLEDGKE